MMGGQEDVSVGVDDVEVAKIGLPAQRGVLAQEFILMLQFALDALHERPFGDLDFGLM
jgi:hypothetical protein